MGCAYKDDDMTYETVIFIRLYTGPWFNLNEKLFLGNS